MTAIGRYTKATAASDNVITPSDGTVLSLRSAIIGAIAYPTQVTHTATSAHTGVPPAVRFNPTTAPTPPRPTTSPITRTGENTVRSPSRQAITVPTSGTIAINSATRLLLSRSSAEFSRNQGPAISIAANVNTIRQCASAGRITPRRNATGSSSSAP